jgi:exopolysaccharide biosynthesis polyprenyl glycosylphosphotransferase
MSFSSAGWAKTYARGLRLIDAFALVIVGAIALLLSRQSLSFPVSGGPFVQSIGMTYAWLFAGFLVVWLFLLELVGSRRPDVFAKGSNEFVDVLNATLAMFFVTAAISFLIRAEPSRLFIGLFLGIGFVALLFARTLGRRFIWLMRSRNRMLTTLFFVGPNSFNASIESRLVDSGQSGYRSVGSIDIRDSRLETGGQLAELVRSIELSGAEPDMVILSEPTLMAPEVLEEFAARLELIPVAFAVAATPDGVSIARLKFQPESGAPILRVRDVQLSSLSRAAKRMMDLFLAVGALVLILPIMLGLATAVRLDSPGQAFFRQERVGQFGRAFTIYKFRTMFVDAEQRLANLSSSPKDAGNAILFKLKDDPRVTRVGRILRRWSVDELPQLINVVLGHMSLVGPRPPLPSEVRDYDGPAYRRLAAKPGLTGLWQVSGRSDLSWEASLRLDLQYVENWSPLSDALILLKTIPAVLGRKGAY